MGWYIIEKPIIEKEFVVVPADVDLNEFNKLSNSGSIPKDLSEILRKMNEQEQEINLKTGVNHDRYKAA